MCWSDYNVKIEHKKEKKAMQRIENLRKIFIPYSYAEIKKLLDYEIISKKDIEFADSERKSLLVSAVRAHIDDDSRNLKQIIEKFVEMNADVRAVDEKGDSLGTLAISADNTENAKIILETYLKGEDIDINSRLLESIIESDNLELLDFVSSRIKMTNFDGIKKFISNALNDGKTEIAKRGLRLLPDKEKK